MTSLEGIPTLGCMQLGGAETVRYRTWRCEMSKGHWGTGNGDGGEGRRGQRQRPIRYKT